jgi:uncharacterized repeat protein (TIGR03803 family)
LKIHQRSRTFGLTAFLVLACEIAGAQVRLDEFTLPNFNTFADGGLIEAAGGQFYGGVRTGSSFCGAIARVGHDASLTVLHVLDRQSEGCSPSALIQGRDGDFYGTNSDGGPFDLGTVFKISSEGQFTVLHAFAGGADSGKPSGPLIQGADGRFYGATSCYFPCTGGIIFSVNAAGEFTNFADVAAQTDGGRPVGPLILARDGSFYGTTFFGQAQGHCCSFEGTVYRVTPAGSVSVLHSFQGGGFDGAHPRAGVISASDGNFYGTTADGGAFDGGTLFRMTPDGTVTILQSFHANTHAYTPLIEHGDGYLYGTGGGGLFRVALDGNVTRLHTFGGLTPLMKSRDGHIWVTSSRTLLRLPDGPSSVVAIDSPRTGQVTDEPFVMTGWAIDRTALVANGIDSVHVWAYPDSGAPPTFVGAAGFGTARADVGSTYGPLFTNSGFALAVRNLAAGTYRLVAYPHSRVWNAFDFRSPATTTVTVRSVETSRPRIGIDGPSSHASIVSPFAIQGWALDLASLQGSAVDAVHIYAYRGWSLNSTPIFLGAAAIGGSRSDVGAAFGPTFSNSGFGLTGTLSPGPYRLVVFARSTLTGLFASETRDITVRLPGNPQMNLDSPANESTVSQPFVVAGWAIDTDAAPPRSGVDAIQVWAYPGTGAPPIFLGQATYGGWRPDVSALFDGPANAHSCDMADYPGLYTCPFYASGFGLGVSGLPPGVYRLIVYAHSSVTGTFNNERSTVLTVR